MFSNRSNPPLCQVSMFNTSPISRKCDITVRTCKLLRHIIPLEEIDRNCLQLSYALFFGLIHISLTFSERDVGTALSYRDKNHFGASISRKTNFKSSIWKWQRRHFRKLLEVARFSLRDVTMAKIVRTNKLPSSPPTSPPAPLSLIKLIHYGDVPLDRIRFITSLSQRVYDFVRVCQQGISCKIDLICGMNFVCSPSTQK